MCFVEVGEEHNPGDSVKFKNVQLNYCQVHEGSCSLTAESGNSFVQFKELQVTAFSQLVHLYVSAWHIISHHALVATTTSIIIVFRVELF